MPERVSANSVKSTWFDVQPKNDNPALNVVGIYKVLNIWLSGTNMLTKLSNGIFQAEVNEPQVQIEAPDLPVCRWEALPERCDFEDETMPIDFQSLRVPMDETWVSLRKRSGFLSIKGRESLCSTHHQSMIARRQQDFNFTATTRLEFQPDTFQQMAGLAYYYNTRHFYYLFMSWEESLNSYVLNIFVNDDKSLE